MSEYVSLRRDCSDFNVMGERKKTVRKLPRPQIMYITIQIGAYVPTLCGIALQARWKYNVKNVYFVQSLRCVGYRFYSLLVLFHILVLCILRYSRYNELAYCFTLTMRIN